MHADVRKTGTRFVRSVACATVIVTVAAAVIVARAGCRARSPTFS